MRRYLPFHRVANWQKKNIEVVLETQVFRDAPAHSASERFMSGNALMGERSAALGYRLTTASRIDGFPSPQPSFLMLS